MNNGRRIYHGVQEEYTEVTEGKRKERASLFRKSLFHLKTPCPPWYSEFPSVVNILLSANLRLRCRWQRGSGALRICYERGQGAAIHIPCAFIPNICAPFAGENTGHHPGHIFICAVYLD